VRARIVLSGSRRHSRASSSVGFAITAAGDETSVAVHLEHHGF